VHDIRAGWKNGRVTSALAFDIKQYYPSMDHGILCEIIRRLGFPAVACKFFESYLKGRSTRYTIDAFQSRGIPTEGGVGQGSSLSPILCNIYLTAAHKLYDMTAISKKVTLSSFIDDGLLRVQDKNTAINVTHLQMAWGTLREILETLGLEASEGKFECKHFHLDRFRDKDRDVRIGEVVVTTSEYWRYLGFYFDRRLRFEEHIRRYCNKAFSSIPKALGNSARGLLVSHKRQLYTACVLPIATYGYRLWYHPKARIKTITKCLASMQRTAAIWITGAYRTSPQGVCDI